MRSLSDRYMISVDPASYTIFVEDAYDGFARRPANTVSGGESFIVSLALALALSDVGDKIATNIMFIDEGFGTLSEEPLRKAIETLRNLQKHAGRRIGIISHVEGLKEEIPIQIRVEQPANKNNSDETNEQI